MTDPISDNALNTLFRRARSFNGWKDAAVPELLMRAVYDLTKWGPTAANGCPARFIFLAKGAESKDRLKPFLDESNIEKTMTAPWTVICAHDLDFHEKLPELFPHAPSAKDWFADAGEREVNAFRNGTLQSAYMLIAARALGLDCGPMSGFDNVGVDGEFMTGERSQWRSNWLCNIGHGEHTSVLDRLPRLDFDDACVIL